MALNPLTGPIPGPGTIEREGQSMAAGRAPIQSDLADEIERRKLKFADVAEGHYEMLSEDELALICRLLRGIEREPA